MNIQAADGYRYQIIALLSAEKLPVEDLPKLLENFRVVLHNGHVIAVAGFEVYGNYALLRSVAVAKDFRNLGIADKLVHNIEQLAGVKELQTIYLFTETAAQYFLRKGYQTIERSNTPTDIQQSSQFSSGCPQSATVMQKTLSSL